MPVNTAVIETLTAEVKVLMVGSRQVTLSVARQLDEVDWDECEPFGRIRYTRNNEPELAIIGKDSAGNLCRSKIDSSDLRTMNNLLRQYKAGSYFCGNYQLSNGEIISGGSGHYLTKEEHDRWIERQQPLLATYRRQKAEFDSLPLIVLAGLK